MQRWKNWFRFQAGRVEYMAFEWWIMRAGLAWLIYDATPANYPSLAQPSPVGIAKFFDLTWLGAPGTEAWLHPVLLGLCVVFALGLAPMLSAAGLLAIHTAVGTFANSQGGGGGSHHTTNLIGLLLIGQVLGCLYSDAKAFRRGGWRGLLALRIESWEWLRHLIRHPGAGFRKAEDSGEAGPQEFRSLLIYTTQQMLALLYVVSGITKIWRSEGAWLSDVRNIPLQFEKNRMNEYYDTLVMPPQTSAEAMADWIGHHPLLAGVFFSGGLFLELFAFLGLWNRRMGVVFGMAIILMHIAISDLMNLGFAYNKWALFLLWVNVPFWIWALGVRLRHPRLHPG